MLLVSQLLIFLNITKVVNACSYHIRSLRHIRRLIDRETANTLACSIVATRLDYCNAVPYGITNKDILRLQRVQNSLARLVCAAPYCCPSAPLLQLFHRLPVTQRIIYKVATLTFKTRLHHQPTYLYDLLTHQPVHRDHLPPTCYRNQQQRPRHLTRHSPTLLLKPGITYQQLFDLQHHLFSIAFK